MKEQHHPTHSPSPSPRLKAENAPRLEADYNPRAVLERQREALLADLMQDLHEAREGVEVAQADEPKDELDSSAAMERESTRFSLMHMKGETLARVNEALDRINNGTYGRCESCDEPIASSRLRALPFAVRCRHCQELREDVEQAQARAARQVRRLKLGW